VAIDFAALAARLLQQSRSLLAEWYPQGKLVGHEYKIGDVFGGEGDSLSINVNSGQWSDFATGEKGGDLISLYAAREGLTQGDAAKKLAGDSTIVSRISTTPPAQQTEPEAWIAIMPVPGDAGAPSNEYWRKGPKNAAGEQEWLKLRYIARWAYLDSEGRTLGYAVRFEWHEGEKLCKDIVPQTYCTNSKREKRWRWKSFPGKRPLYGLDQLAARPDAPVMVVEGEKKVEALKSIAPQYVGVAWPGGAAAWQKADWTPIKGRVVTCWPDADKQVIRTERQATQFKRAIGDLIPADHQPGIKAMWEIGHHLLKLCPTVKVIIPDDPTLPDGWDCADAVRDGWDWKRLKAWALSRVFTLTEGGNNARCE
jgi:putative DNA primase/helicase